MDPFVVSGPFQVDNFAPGQFMSLSPPDGHPEYSPQHNLTLQAYDSNQTAFQALRANEIQGMTDLPAGSIERADEEIPDAEIVDANGFTPYRMYPQHSVPPFKFQEMREAVGAAINRRNANELAYAGLSDPITYAAAILDNHPWIEREWLTDFTDQPEGDVEAARQVLADAGWGWDDDGNLRYPADADLEPLWPKEGAPNPDAYPCLNEDGYVRPEGYEMTEDQVPGYNMSPEDVWPDF
jgi:peptide/nickel transport system substrate-binding protein